MNFPKIETIYGLYLRGRLDPLPRGLGYAELYYRIAESVARVVKKDQHEKAVAAPFRMTERSPGSEDKVAESFRHLTSIEAVWLLQGRTEFRVTTGFLSRTVHMSPDFPVRALFRRKKRHAVRLVWPKGSLCCGLTAAYVEVFLISELNAEQQAKQRELHGDDDIIISVAECTGTDPIASPPMPRVIFTGKSTETVTEILSRKAKAVLAEMCEELIKEGVATESVVMDHGGFAEILGHALPLTTAGLLSILLLEENHRFVQRVSPLIQPRRRAGLPVEPVCYLIGDKLDRLSRDSEKVVLGKVTWEAPEGDEDGQVLIEWPTEKAEQTA